MKKPTHDEHYTPKKLYDEILRYVKYRYNISDDVEIVRPFYPGGDYENYDYPEGCVVVDNPPFSIEGKIIDFYEKHKIKYFLFCNGLSTIAMLKDGRENVSLIVTDSRITYESGVTVNTGFLTNLEEIPCIKNDIFLRDIIKKYDKKKETSRIDSDLIDINLLTYKVRRGENVWLDKKTLNYIKESEFKELYGRRHYGQLWRLK